MRPDERKTSGPGTSRCSRLPGWYRLDRTDRVSQLADWLGVASCEIEAASNCGALSLAEAERLVENVVGIHALPFSIAPNFVVNGRDVLVPMVIEEASVVAAAANAARLARAGGGFRVTASGSIMICQIQVFTDDLAGGRGRILAGKDELLAAAAAVDPVLVELGGGPVDLEVRTIADTDEEPGFLVVHLLVDVADAMGANAVNTMGEAIAPRLARITCGRSGLCILSNLADRRLVGARLDLPLDALSATGCVPERLRDAIVSASRFAERDPYRAATHNKGIMNGVDAVLLATGNDWRAVEAGAHAYAARSGAYLPLCVWRTGAGGGLSGRLEMPMAVGTVGGATRTHRGARLALDILGVNGASELACIAAAVGMANNLAALRALATEGIQKGHMRLHRRSRETAARPA